MRSRKSLKLVGISIAKPCFVTVFPDLGTATGKHKFPVEEQGPGLPYQRP